MKTIGITNPLLIAIALVPIYLFYTFIRHMGNDLFSNGPSSYIAFTVMLTLFVIGPVILLLFIKLLIVGDKKIRVIYPFRLKSKAYPANELMSVFSQKMLGNNAFPFDFYQTLLYFGGERRIRFNALEFVNYRSLRLRLEGMEQTT